MAAHTDSSPQLKLLNGVDCVSALQSPVRYAISNYAARALVLQYMKYPVPFAIPITLTPSLTPL